MRISDWSSDVCSSDLQAAGADAALVVAPYYNKPNQEGVFRHFAYLAQNSALPILPYNVPSRTITDTSVDVMKRLRACPTIVGVKDATGSLGRVTAQRLACGDDFCQLSGRRGARSEERRGGKECVSKCRSRWSPCH